jgi:PAS domain S-box-containing protein
MGIKMLLANEGVEVQTASDGFEGFELVTQFLPDIVLLDIVMPQMNGIEVCKKIRQTPELLGVYIVMLSGVKIQSDQMAEGIEAGADDYIPRPIPNRELLARLRTFIRFKRTEKALNESEKRFRIAQELSPDGFTILRPVRNYSGQIIDFAWVYENQAIARINGTDPKEVVGKQLLDLFPSHRGSPVFETYLDVANRGKMHILEEVYVGEIVSVPTWLRIVIVSMGEDIAILAQDITLRKQAEQKLIELKDQLEVKVEEKTKELKERISDLERFHDATINREIRMKEQRDEIKRLKGDI